MKSFKNFISEEVLLEGLPNKAFIGDKDIAKLERAVASGAPKAVTDELFDKVMDKYQSLLDRSFDKAKAIIKQNSRKIPPIKMYFNAKPIKSIKDKVINRGKRFSELNDLVRGTITFKTSKEADDWVKAFVRKAPGNLVGEYEKKEKGQETQYGYYGPHHLLLDVGGIYFELQVMSRKMWSYKAAAHDIYAQNRSKAGGPSSGARHMSNKLFNMGNQSGYRRESFEDDDEWELVEEINFEDMI